MDVLMLSRLQFAAATFFHFLFVPLTLGLSILIAIMETIYVRTGDEEYRRMAKFWGKIFLVNFAGIRQHIQSFTARRASDGRGLSGSADF